jgi:hypothetical protein
MLAAGFTAEDVDTVLWRNPVAFYGQSGKLEPADSEASGADATYQGNSVLRGARAEV